MLQVWLKVGPEDYVAVQKIRVETSPTLSITLSAPGVQPLRLTGIDAVLAAVELQDGALDAEPEREAA